jgi:hypothetical protein
MEVVRPNDWDKQPLVAGPAAVGRVEWVPEAERVVIGVAVL